MKIEEPDDVEAANDVVTSLARRKRRHVAPRADAPTIKIDAGTGAAARVVDQSEAALIAARRGLYQRDGWPARRLSRSTIATMRSEARRFARCFPKPE
jgi:hypothetical protein